MRQDSCRPPCTPQSGCNCYPRLQVGRLRQGATDCGNWVPRAEGWAVGELGFEPSPLASSPLLTP